MAWRKRKLVSSIEKYDAKKDSSVAEYRLIGYEKRILKREEFNNDKVDAGDIHSGRTVTAIS
jgi:hypothetical protein